MKVVVKKTNEVSDEEILSIYNLYERIFQQKHEVSHFREMFTNSSLGYSYHSFLLNDESEIVGFHSCMPFYYFKGEEKFLAALGINSMVHPEYRDFFHFSDMFLACQRATKEDGCKLRIGFPNDNSYPIVTKGFRHRLVGELSTYILPIRIGGIKKSMRALNFSSQLFSIILVGLSKLNRSKRIHKVQYQKDRDSFDKYRFKWFGASYKIVETNDIKFVYKVNTHEGVDVAFLLDVYPLNGKNFDQAVRCIYKKERANVDMIMYIGNLKFRTWSLLKVPNNFAPKKFRFTIYKLDKKFFDNSILDINNWELNLSNYDLL